MSQEFEEHNNPNQSEKFTYKKLNASDVHVSKPENWLEARFHFRFGDWMPTDRSFYNFGVLHLLNDALVQPLNGFGTHSHQDEEIFTYVINGELTHEDSAGNKETLPRGAVQYMSAGTGISHSESNNNPKMVCHFLQTWIYPCKKDLPIKYEAHKFEKTDRLNKLLHMTCGLKSTGAPIKLQQDVNIYASEIEKNKQVSYKLEENRQAYLVNVEGTLKINDFIEMETNSAIRMWGPINLTFRGIGDGENQQPSAHFMLIEMEKSNDL